MLKRQSLAIHSAAAGSTMGPEPRLIFAPRSRKSLTVRRFIRYLVPQWQTEPPLSS